MRLFLDLVLWSAVFVILVVMLSVVVYFLDHLCPTVRRPRHFLIREVPMERYTDWADVIDELDAKATMTHDAEDFIISLVETKPTYLSPKQVAWLKDLKAQHIGD